MKKSSQPIIISGSPRSGSTWIGRVLSQHPETKYVHEPFNVGIKRDDSPLSLWQEGIQMDRCNVSIQSTVGLEIYFKK